MEAVLKFTEQDEQASKKVFKIFTVQRSNGTIDNQLVIIDPYMTINIDLSDSMIVNLHKEFSNIIKSKNL